ncbi:L,D-transpeptidase family protein [Azospirillum formosense]|uniref:L,D-transpeptidase family protein n=1 Tax=Azospirillum formosense TaxID=861533 RepID=UPI001C929224|nr:L,D-transpeptidase family protein [Azospirillum formosense]
MGAAVLLRPMVVLCAVLAALAFAPVPAAAADIIGSPPFGIAFATADDTLADIAIDNDLGYTEIIMANPTIDPWLPGDGALVVLPTAHILPSGSRNGIVINLAEQRLYRFAKGKPPASFPVGIGAEAANLRTGSTQVRAKRVDPPWMPTARMREEDPELPSLVPPGPDNPLGPKALYLDWPGIVIHGTNKPYGVGRRVSHGCFRLHNPDIERLYQAVPVGTPVRVVDEPVKLGWLGDTLYIEVHLTTQQADSLEETGRFEPPEFPKLEEAVTRAAGRAASRVDWGAVHKAAEEQRGIPLPILRASLKFT